MKKIALVTGASRGIGLEVARQLAASGLKVLVGARDLARARAAAAEMKGEAVGLELDVASSESIARAVAQIAQEYGRLDVLVNNAGVLLDADWPASASAKKIPVSLVRETFETNTLGPYQLCQALLPLMEKGGYGRVVNVSSGMGQLSEMNAGYPAYRISKTALNAVTRVFSEEYASAADIKVNSVCPGWVKTDMGGEGAERSVAEGAETIVWAATLPASGPTGGFFRDKRALDW